MAELLPYTKSFSLNEKAIFLPSVSNKGFMLTTKQKLHLNFRTQTLQYVSISGSLPCVSV